MGVIVLIAIAYGIYLLFFKQTYVLLKNPGASKLQIVKDVYDSNKFIELATAKFIVDNTPYMMVCSSYLKAKKLADQIKKDGATAEVIIHFIWQKKITVGSQNPIQ